VISPIKVARKFNLLLLIIIIGKFVYYINYYLLTNSYIRVYSHRIYIYNIIIGVESNRMNYIHIINTFNYIRKIKPVNNNNKVNSYLY